MPATGFDSWDDALRDMVDDTYDAGHIMADEMVDHGLKSIERNTPVETFHLRRSYQRTPITYQQGRDGAGRYRSYVWTGTVFTEVEYAAYVEHGTGLWGPMHKKYEIRPKNPGGYLRFAGYSHGPGGAVVLDVNHEVTKGGRTVYTRFVLHPGSPGHHMFQIGVRLTEMEMDEWSRFPLELWRDSVEGRLARA